MVGLGKGLAKNATSVYVQARGTLQQAAETPCWAAADWQAAWACRLWQGACLEELLPRAVAQLLVVLLQDLAQPDRIDLGILPAPMRLLSQPVRLYTPGGNNCLHLLGVMQVLAHG